MGKRSLKGAKGLKMKTERSCEDILAVLEILDGLSEWDNLPDEVLKEINYNHTLSPGIQISLVPGSFMFDMTEPYEQENKEYVDIHNSVFDSFFEQVANKKKEK